MSAQTASIHPTEGMSREEQLAMLFAQLIIQQSNMAMMLLGKVPHPESGKVQPDIEAARFFIDQLEMLEAKTKGNLSKDEESLLKQTLMRLRLAFVEAVESSPGGQAQPTPQTRPAPSAKGQEAGGSEVAGAPAGDEEHRKKFTKKY